MPPTITITTQNVGGRRGEFQSKHGPKFGILRRLAKRNKDFCVFTEVRCDKENIKKAKLHTQMKQSLYSVLPYPTRDLYFGPKTIFIPAHLFWKWYFSPTPDMSFFESHHGLFALILPYFEFILPFYFPFSHFISPFFLFFIIFPLFLFAFSYFSPQMTSADIFPWGVGVIFQYIDPCIQEEE